VLLLQWLEPACCPGPVVACIMLVWLPLLLLLSSTCFQCVLLCCCVLRSPAGAGTGLLLRRSCSCILLVWLQLLLLFTVCSAVLFCAVAAVAGMGRLLRPSWSARCRSSARSWRLTG
jgi:hypothetical protein